MIQKYYLHVDRMEYHGRAVHPRYPDWHGPLKRVRLYAGDYWGQPYVVMETTWHPDIEDGWSFPLHRMDMTVEEDRWEEFMKRPDGLDDEDMREREMLQGTALAAMFQRMREKRNQPPTP